MDTCCHSQEYIYHHLCLGLACRTTELSLCPRLCLGSLFFSVFAGFIKFPPWLSFQLKNKFMKKLPRDAEASNVLVGEVDFLDAPFVAFVRLQQAVMLGALTEVPVPTRYNLNHTSQIWTHQIFCYLKPLAAHGDRLWLSSSVRSWIIWLAAYWLEIRENFVGHHEQVWASMI